MSKNNTLLSSLLMLIIVISLTLLTILLISPGSFNKSTQGFQKNKIKYPVYTAKSEETNYNNTISSIFETTDIIIKREYKTSSVAHLTNHNLSQITFPKLNHLPDYVTDNNFQPNELNSLQQESGSNSSRKRSKLNRKLENNIQANIKLDGVDFKNILYRNKELKTPDKLNSSDMNIIANPVKSYIPIAPNDPGTVSIGKGSCILLVLISIYATFILFKHRKINHSKIHLIILLVGYTQFYTLAQTISSNEKKRRIPEESTANLYIANTEKLFIGASTTIYISGDLIINSTDSNSSQIKSSSAITVAGQTILEKTFEGGKWYFFSIPYEITEDQIFKVENGVETTATWGDAFGGAYVAGKDLYIAEYDTDTRDRQTYGSPNFNGAGVYWKNVNPRTLEANKGYIIALDGNISMKFRFKSSVGASSINFNGVNKTIRKSSTSNLVVNHSWNLVGNPYFSAFDLKDASNHKPYYLYNGSTYNTILGDISDDASERQMNSFTAFFCQAFDANSDIAFNTSGKLFRAPNAVESPDYQIIKLALSNSDSTQLLDAVRIRIGNQFSDNYVLGEDAAKIASIDNSVPQIFCNHFGVDLSVNSIPKINNSINIKIYIPKEGKYKIDLLLSEYATEIEEINLFDNQNTILHSLTSDKTYEFYSLTGMTERFSLKLTPKITSSILDAENGITISKQFNNLSIIGLNEPSIVNISDLSGKIIYSKKDITSNTSLPIFNTGLFIISIKNNSQQLIKKILL